MAACASLVFTLLLCACVHTLVECESTCSNKLECTIYTMKEVGRKVDHMQSNMTSIVNQLTQIQALHTFQKMIQDLQEHVQNQNEEILHLKEQVNSHESKLNVLDSVNTQHNDKIQALTMNMDKTESSIYFTAYSTVDRQYNVNDVVQFDGLLVNNGGFFNSSTGYFTCSYTGYYLFSITVSAKARLMMAAQILVDDIAFVSALARDTAEHDQATAITIVKCESGQQVWVRCRGSGNWMKGGSGTFSTFTGALLKVI